MQLYMVTLKYLIMPLLMIIREYMAMLKYTVM
jgi:hypothetical protein